jgi:hypothetical protein
MNNLNRWIYRGHRRIYGGPVWLWTALYIHRFGHVIDEYTWPIFVGDVAEPMNIGGAGWQVQPTYIHRLTDEYSRQLWVGSFSLRAHSYHCTLEPFIRHIARRSPTSLVIAAARLLRCRCCSPVAPPPPPCNRLKLGPDRHTKVIFLFLVNLFSN